MADQRARLNALHDATTGQRYDDAQYRLRIVRRIAGLIVRLQGLRYLPPLDELAHEFGVCTRTIRRDLQVLEQAGVRVPIWRFNERLCGDDVDDEAAYG